MFKNVVSLFIVFLLSGSAFSQTLILSDKLQLQYDAPQLISHTADTLIVKYKNWSFMHELVNPKNMYPRIDLSGIERIYLHSIFDAKEKEKLPKWLGSLAEEQAQLFGVRKDNVRRKNVAGSEIVAVFNSAHSSSHIYIFEELKIHHIEIHGDEKMLSDVIENIGVR